MQQQPASDKNIRNIRRILGLCLAAALVFFLLTNDRKGITVEIGENSLTLAYSAEERWDIPFADIRSMALEAAFDRGAEVQGTTSRVQAFGAWKNAAYGAYRLCAFENVPACIVLETDGGVVAFNYESVEATEKLFEALGPLVNP